MRSYVTSFNSLFSLQRDGAPVISQIEIPVIQRDYAQGREGKSVARIRQSFLDVLHDALTDGNPVSLDFVYGDVENGTLRPLDGQQRLTTLFLLHWYLAWRTGRLEQDQGQDWKRFSYATRASSRLFCERLSRRVPPAGQTRIRAWIEDQSWFLHTWRHDPTIQAMLVMLDSIEQRFATADCERAWQRLVDRERPAISFHLLPIEKMGLGEDLYIKMNSRGKPLTEFENFKARFEQVLESSCPDRVKQFAWKIDGEWADILWRYRGGDDIVDDEFVRYIRFVTEICKWRDAIEQLETTEQADGCEHPDDGAMPDPDLDSLCESVYAPGNSRASEHLNFLFQCFDTWATVEIASVFSGAFTKATASAPGTADTGKVVLFSLPAEASVDLFEACCRDYGEVRGRNRVFGVADTLLLYAVILHRIRQTCHFPRRLRTLRNLIEASSNGLRLERMPALLRDVDRLVVDGLSSELLSFNQAQVADEHVKADLLDLHPSLEPIVFELEDHPILHGCLFALDMDVETIGRRALAFRAIFDDTSHFPVLTGALLAAGDYSRAIGHRSFQLGSGSNPAPWRSLFTSGSRASLERTRTVLCRVLDAVADRGATDVRSALESLAADWLDGVVPADGLDWRWYLVKYPVMRDGRSGIYAGSGYNLCMLDKTQMNSLYRDPYLAAIQRESGVMDGPDERFTGYETERRWLRLTGSGAALACVPEGLLVSLPDDSRYAEAFARVCAAHGVGDNRLLKVPQVEVGGRCLDTQDRVKLGAALLRDLSAAGL